MRALDPNAKARPTHRARRPGRDAVVAPKPKLGKAARRDTSLDDLEKRRARAAPVVHREEMSTTLGEVLAVAQPEQAEELLALKAELPVGDGALPATPDEGAPQPAHDVKGPDLARAEPHDAPGDRIPRRAGTPAENGVSNGFVATVDPSGGLATPENDPPRADNDETRRKTGARAAADRRLSPRGFVQSCREALSALQDGVNDAATDLRFAFGRARDCFRR